MTDQDQAPEPTPPEEPRETTDATDVPTPVDGGEVPEIAEMQAHAEGRNLGVIMDLDLPLTVRFGRTQMTLGALMEIGPGTVVGLERAPTDPAELLVNGKVIARGEVVAVGGQYAVRITDIVSPSERIRNLGG